jgi:hypothetical protein
MLVVGRICWSSGGCQLQISMSQRRRTAQLVNVHGRTHALRLVRRYRHAGLLCPGRPQSLVHPRLCLRVWAWFGLWVFARRVAVRRGRSHMGGRRGTAMAREGGVTPCFQVLGLQVLGLQVLGFQVLGFQVLGFQVLGFQVLARTLDTMQPKPILRSSPCEPRHDLNMGGIAELIDRGDLAEAVAAIDQQFHVAREGGGIA